MKNKIKKILATTDFSAAATNATNYAAEMAIAINADLVLLHIASLPLGFGGMVMANTPEAIMSQAEEEIKKQRDRLIKKTASHQLDIYTEVRMGLFLTELNLVCEKEEPYAVVMGSQGKTASERLIFGGHTVNTMRNLCWPVITVPPGANFSAIKKIAFACDLDNTNVVPIDELKILTKEFNAELHIINTGRKSGYDPIKNLKTGWLRIGLDPIKPTYHFIDDSNTDTAIINFAEANNIDLLIVLPKRHGLFDQLTYKSTSKRVVLHCHVPVMALHQ